MPAKKKEVKRVEVTLKKAHTHAGEAMKKGDKINVTEDQVSWLKEREVI